GGWPRLRGREVEGTTVGIVGMGAIGRRVASVMVAMGAEVLAHDPMEPALGALAARVRYVPLDELLRAAGIVTLHCPMTSSGLPMIDAAILEEMRPGAILVNTARAGLIDDAAVVAALEAERLGCYATDVFAEEPPRDKRLSAHPRVIATSHIGGFTDGSVTRATEAAVENLLKHLAVQNASA
ncbi:NAD(P)-dependent oxidoreductase, partial [Nitratireductor sp. GCM10026969]|uniref:NAD(P)-dependent oxidoreductase n=1 Tax=Nitratireductor sp. GCM10026969 TaxID=3252645 RepID=UPI00362249DA